MREAPGWWPVVGIVAALAVTNLVSNELLPDALYVPWALLVAVGLVVLTRRLDGRSLDELGLEPGHLRRGLRWGLVVAAATLVVFLLALAVPATRKLFEDDRVVSLAFPEVLYAALIRVPLGTVVLEEVAFRGVLPAVLDARLPRRLAVAVAALAFGLWHILPAWGLGTVNPIAENTIGDAPQIVPLVGAVVATAFVHVWLWWLRHRSGHLVAPVLAHWATNSLGYLFAYAVLRY